MGYLAILLISFITILMATLYPFHFYGRIETYSELIHILRTGRFGVIDFFQNILLFMPLGFGIGGFLSRTIKCNKLLSASFTIIVSFIFSYIIETLQVFQPGRFSSMVDVISNSGGGLIGYLCFITWQKRAGIYRSLVDYARANLASFIFFYISLMLLFSFSVKLFSSLMNWDKTFPLLIGNERTGDRPWKGYIKKVFIADRAIPEVKVPLIFLNESEMKIFDGSLIALYHFNDSGLYKDETGIAPDLLWKGETGTFVKGKGVLISPRQWLRSNTYPIELSKKLIESSEFTIGITLSSARADQRGPARIISLSGNAKRRNFTLAQKGDDLVFRLRTPLTGKNGTRPYLTIPDVLSNTEEHEIIAVYNGGSLRVYVDDVQHQTSLYFSPGGIPLSYLFDHKRLHLVVFKLIFYIVLFVPLGFILSLIIALGYKSRSRAVLLVIGLMILSPLLIEFVYSVARDFRWENFLTGILISLVSMIIFRMLTGIVENSRMQC